MGNEGASRATLELANSEEFKRLVDTEDISVADLTELLVNSRVPDAGKLAGYVYAWEDYVFIVDSSLTANVSNPAAMVELLEQRGLAGHAEE